MIEKDIEVEVGQPLPSPVMFTQFLEQSKCPICDKEKTLQLTGTVLYTSPGLYHYRCSNCGQDGHVGYDSIPIKRDGIIQQRNIVFKEAW